MYGGNGLSWCVFLDVIPSLLPFKIIAVSILFPHSSWCRTYPKADILCFSCNIKFMFLYETQGPVNEVLSTDV